jgi:hypothetical protein
VGSGVAVGVGGTVGEALGAGVTVEDGDGVGDGAGTPGPTTKYAAWPAMIATISSPPATPAIRLSRVRRFDWPS